MKRIRQTTIDSKDVYNQNIDSKQGDRKKRLKRIKADVFRRYDWFNANLNNLSGIATSPFPRGYVAYEALIHSYESSTKPVDALRNSLMENHYSSVGSFCQYCGVDQIQTLDHFLPKGVFPEFSIYHTNLVPSCFHCNGEKGENSNSNEFIFLYAQDPNAHRFLYADVVMSGTSPVISYRLVQPGGMAATFFNTVENHFANLRLISLFKTAFPDLVSELVNTIRANGVDDRPGIVSSLNNSATAYRDTYGLNNWKAVAAEGLAACAGFIDFLEDEI